MCIQRYSYKKMLLHRFSTFRRHCLIVTPPVEICGSCLCQCAHSFGLELSMGWGGHLSWTIKIRNSFFWCWLEKIYEKKLLLDECFNFQRFVSDQQTVSFLYSSQLIHITVMCYCCVPSER